MSPGVHPLPGTNVWIYLSDKKAEIVAYAFESQFSTNAGTDLPEFQNSVIVIGNAHLTNNFFTSLYTLQDIKLHLPKTKALGEYSISNSS